MRKAFSLLGLLVLSACSTKSNEHTAVISPNVHLVSADAVAGVSVLADRLVFPKSVGAELLARNPGDIIVSAAGSQAGFLRKVVAVTDDGSSVSVQTEAATLPEAITSGAFSSVHELSGDADSGPSVQPQDLGGALGGHYNLTGLALGARDSALGGQIDVSVQRGHINITPRLDVGLSINGASVDQFHAVASGTLDAELVIAVKARGFFSKDFKSSIAPIKVAEISNRFWEAVGWVPVEENVKFHVYLGCYVGFGGEADFSGGGTFTDTIKAGVKYDHGQWAPVAGQDMKIGMEASFVAHADAFAKCYLQYRVDLAFYESVGPAFWVQPYVQGDIFSTPAPAHYKARAGLEGYAGAKFSILGLKDIAEEKFQLFDLYWPFAEGVIPDAEPGPQPSPGAGGWMSGAPSSSAGSGGTSSGSGGTSSGSGGTSSGSGGASSGGGGTTSAVDPCAKAEFGGLYCTDSRQNGFPGGDPDTLYDCEGGKTAQKTRCANGCTVAPSGTNDSCSAAKAPASTDPCASAQYGGFYCGQSTQNGFADGLHDYLYDCEGNRTASRSYCPTGCNVAPPGHNDACNPASCSSVSCPVNSSCNAGACNCDGDACGSRCCAAGSFCFGNGRCCDGITCTPGCPC